MSTGERVCDGRSSDGSAPARGVQPRGVRRAPRRGSAPTSSAQPRGVQCAVVWVFSAAAALGVDLADSAAADSAAVLGVGLADGAVITLSVGLADATVVVLGATGIAGAVLNATGGQRLDRAAERYTDGQIQSCADCSRTDEGCDGGWVEKSLRQGGRAGRQEGRRVGGYESRKVAR